MQVRVCGECNLYLLVEVVNMYVQIINVFMNSIQQQINASNVVYLAVCSLCSAFYVGKTNRKLRFRIGKHLLHIRNGTLNALAKHISLHSFTFLVI